MPEFPFWNPLQPKEYPSSFIVSNATKGVRPVFFGTAPNRNGQRTTLTSLNLMAQKERMITTIRKESQRGDGNSIRPL